jgi:hypothetical protein
MKAHMSLLCSWFWPISAVVLVPLAIFAPPPGDLPEPQASKHLFDEPVLVSPDHGSYRFVSFSEGEWKKFKPVYAATFTVNSAEKRSRSFGFDHAFNACLFYHSAVMQYQVVAKGTQEVQNSADDGSEHGIDFGFFHRSATWKYQLALLRFDNHEGDADGPLALPDNEIAKVRPMIVTELNRCATGRGDLLTKLLDSGEQASDSVICWQNAIVLLAWLSLPMAVISLVARLASFRRLPSPATTAVPQASRAN